MDVSFLPKSACTRNLNAEICKYFSVPNSAQTQTVESYHSTFEGLKPLAGVCLFKSFGNDTVVSVVRLHNSLFRDIVQCEIG